MKRKPGNWQNSTMGSVWIGWGNVRKLAQWASLQTVYKNPQYGISGGIKSGGLILCGKKNEIPVFCFFQETGIFHLNNANYYMELCKSYMKEICFLNCGIMSSSIRLRCRRRAGALYDSVAAMSGKIKCSLSFALDFLLTWQ